MYWISRSQFTILARGCVALLLILFVFCISAVQPTYGAPMAINGTAVSQTRALGGNPIQVAVLRGADNFGGYTRIAAQLNDDTYYDFNATVVVAADIDTIAELDAYDVVVFGNNGYGATDSVHAIASTLRSWVEAGGGIVATGWIIYSPDNADLDAMVPVNTGNYNYAPGGTLNVTVAHEVTQGVANFIVPGGCFIEYPGSFPYLDTGATELGQTNGQPTVAINTIVDGRSVYLGPIYSAADSYDCNGVGGLRDGNADHLLENAVFWAKGSFTIGDTVWEDSNPTDGIQDGAENGVNGVTVRLYQDDGNGIPDTGVDTLMGTAVTANNGMNDGFYEFNESDGDYFLEFVLPTGFTFTARQQGGDPTLDSDVYPGTGLTDIFTINGNDDVTLDAGLFGTPVAAVGDYVWNDVNMDGVQDGGEVGFNGMTVNLYRDNGDATPDTANDYLIDTTTSFNNGSDGYYEFPNLAEASYFVAFELPIGYIPTIQNAGGDDTLDSDADPVTGLTAVFFLPDAAVDDTVDAGYIPVYAIGDYVWGDVNGNGIQDGGESGQIGVTVNLYADVDGDNLPEPGVDDGAAINTAVTDATGSYLFTNNPIGDYFVEFVLPGGYIFSPQNQGGDDTLDSDADVVTGLTAVFTLSADDTSRDAGLSPLPITVDSPGDIIDANACFMLTIADLPGPDGVITLREAICAANNTPGLDLINFAPALNGIPIVLTSTGMWEEGNEFGDLDIRDNLIIQGSGTTNTIVDGNASDRVFHIPWVGSIEVTLNDLTITNGNILFNDVGGGIYNGDGQLTLNQVLMENNRGDLGGAIYSCCNPFSTLTLNNSTLQFNTAGYYGGAMYTQSAQVTLEASNILNNTAGFICCGNGGGLFLENGGGSITNINQSSISNNTGSGGDGGGIYNNTDLTLTNSTLSGNTVTGSGGGLINWNVLRLNNSTITDNDASFAGGFYGFGTADIKNSIIAGNTSGGGSMPDDCNAGYNTLGGNVFGNGTGCFSGGGDTTVNPPDVFTLLLNPTLALNGGTTYNHALLSGGAAVDFAADCTTVGGAPVTVDQRDTARPFGAACDSGAYELLAGAIWDGEGVDDNWSTAANWVGDVVPTATDIVIFNTTSTSDAIIDGAFAGQVGGVLIDTGYTGTITMAAPLQVSGDYSQNDGTMMVADPGTFLLTIGGTLTHDGGVLGQIRTVGSGTNVPFLQIEDGSSNVKYRGIELDTTTSGADLGSVTVLIRAIDPGAGEYCTMTGAGSPAYAERCYTITPTTNGPAKVRLWALSASELNGIAEGSLAVYRNVPDGSTTWVELTTTASTGNDGSSYSYAEADTPGFSHFLLGQQTLSPTAVNLQSFSSQTQTPLVLVVLMLVILAAMTGWVFVRRGTRQA